jgi:hypothetical protein
MYMNTEMLRFTLEKYDKYTFMFLPESNINLLSKSTYYIKP